MSIHVVANCIISFIFSSVQFSCSVMSDSLKPHELQHDRPPCPSPTPRVHSNSCPLSQWCHPTISSSVVPFSSCPQFLPASGSFSMSQLFASGGQSIGVSALASVLPVNTQDWSPLGRKWRGTKKPLMKVKQESENVSLKLNIQKMKIMASGPITSWEIDGETINSVRLYFGGLQNHCRWWLQPWN